MSPLSPKAVMDIANALLTQTLRCPCDQPERGTPLCASCACLLSLMVGVLNWQSRLLAPHATPWLREDDFP